MPPHAKIIQLGISGKRSKPRPGISSTGTLLCIFILGPLTKAVFPLLASCAISRRACPAQNRTPAHFSSHRVSRTQTQPGVQGLKHRRCRGSALGRLSVDLGQSSLHHWPAVTASPWEPVCSFQTGDLLVHKVQALPESLS